MLALCCGAVGGRALLSRRRLVSLLLCGLISAAGYWLTAVVLYGGFRAQLIATVPGNLMQALASALLYCAAAAALRSRQPQ